MEKPKNYDTTSSFSGGSPLPPGGYVCRVVNIAEETSRSGRPMVKIALDIAEGPEAGRFAERFNSDTRQPKKWPCVMYQLTTDEEGNCNPGFKGLIEALENDNPGYQTVWGPGFCQAIKNRMLGVVFRNEEYLNQDGKSRMSCKPAYVRSIADIRAGKVEPPADKMLAESKRSHNDDPFSRSVQAEDPGDTFQAIDEDVPF